MNNHAAAELTPEEFLNKLKNSLKSHEALDTELSEIVLDQILTEYPSEDCSDLALAAIIELAAKRAATKKELSDG